MRQMQIVTKGCFLRWKIQKTKKASSERNKCTEGSRKSGFSCVRYIFCIYLFIVVIIVIILVLLSCSYFSVYILGTYFFFILMYFSLARSPLSPSPLLSPILSLSSSSYVILFSSLPIL